MIDALCTTVTATPICLHSHAADALFSGLQRKGNAVRCVLRCRVRRNALCSLLQVGVRGGGEGVANHQKRHVSSERFLQDRLHALAARARQARRSERRALQAVRRCERCSAPNGRKMAAMRDGRACSTRSRSASSTRFSYSASCAAQAGREGGAASRRRRVSCGASGHGKGGWAEKYGRGAHGILKLCAE